ncbi:hypothetical protein ACFE04_002307 [Oxalis oulophora]
MAQAHTSEGATESVESVSFSFLTDEEVLKHSFVKVTNPVLLDAVEAPVACGLYDPRMGPMDERTPCKICGQTKNNCHGHCGHIELVVPAYNPLLFTSLVKILNKTCFHCLHFRVTKQQVDTCVAKLKLIIKGDVVGAAKLGGQKDEESESSGPAESDVSDVSCSTIHMDGQDHDTSHSNQLGWTSLQFTEAMSALEALFESAPGARKCAKCEMKSPKIGKPTFGWIEMGGMGNAELRANAIRSAKRNCKDEDSEADDSTNENPSTTESQGKKKIKMPPEPKMIGGLLKSHLLPSEVKDILKELWENEYEICSFLSDVQQQGLSKKVGHTMFFLDVILVPPIKFRPPARGGDSVMEHPQTSLLNKVLQSNISLGNAYANNLERSMIIRRWMELQQDINILFDSKTVAKSQRGVAAGICQLLEKKEGIFRQKMMGKRVNFACRSVISPDPYLAVNEIGIPPYFAVRLTYPERVTPWNTAKLRNAVINGPDIHPGATYYIDRLSTTRLRENRKQRISISRKLPSSRGAVVQPGKGNGYEFEGKVVHRHLRDGDVVLVNRQPTLHKPSIMAHIVRVLKGEKTIRMHYANCSTYNADFDGDEINVHFPQDDIARAEAYNIVNANNQYVKPTAGDPIRSLIQDHIIGSVLLTKRDTFLDLSDFNQLLYSSGVSSLMSRSNSGRPGRKVYVTSHEEDVLIPRPAILKPKPLWTGKQIISTMLNHITRDQPPFTVEKGGKLPNNFFTGRCDDNNKEKTKKQKRKENQLDRQEPENKMLIRKNELVRGVIDKAQFADYGLVHTVQELYGSNTAGILLSAFSRLFTTFLQMHGFTCGIDDLLIRKLKDEGRKSELEECEAASEEALRDFLKIDKDTKIDPMELQLRIEEVIRRGGENALTSLDRKMTSVVNAKTSSDVMNELLSSGIYKTSGKNCISLMTTSGAKGSKVNFQQISSHLGQQELEGKRVPRMVSGKTLPSFPPWDWAFRAGGFIKDRFLTGLHPQEYYFHCMAGREGLVDTAVKTSRSGYLQRCLVKNLECLKVHYDHTVRDGDGSIVQFQYGEDGIDVHQTSFITKFEALAPNADRMEQKFEHHMNTSNDCISANVYKNLENKARKFIDDLQTKDQDLLKLLESKLVSLKQQFKREIKKFDVVKDKPEKFIDTFMLDKREDFLKILKQRSYIKNLEDRIKNKAENFMDELLSRKQEVCLNLLQNKLGKKSKTLELSLIEELPDDLMKKARKFKEEFEMWERNDFLRLVKHKFLASLAQPGEPVGVLASQSVGEPSTQMTLNTFHLAGRGEANVTLGIPRLQEILMTASKEIKTPVMTCPLLEGKTEEEAKTIADKLKRVTVADVIESMEVYTSQSIRDGPPVTIYKLKIKLHVPEHYPKYADISFKDWKKTMKFVYLRELEDAIQKHMKDLRVIAGLKIFVPDSLPGGPLTNEARKEKNIDDDEEGDGDETEDFGFDAQKRKQRESDDADYDDVSEDEHNDDLLSVASDIDEPKNDGSEAVDNQTGSNDASKEKSGSPSVGDRKEKKTKGTKRRDKLVFMSKETDRHFFVEAKGLQFEVHFKFGISEPHILLAQIAQKTASKVDIQSSGKIDQCRVTTCKESQVIYYGKDLKKRTNLSPEDKEKHPALLTSGLDFKSLYQWHDIIDVRYLYSNSIHAMLTTYGVEAARGTIIREISNVFNSYGISVNTRHLSLIADFMTFTGGYRAMSRVGGISDLTAPLSKMSFETAAKFIVDAAYRGEVDTLETPSSRICLGLPVKMGTGSFDLLQKLEV